VPDAAGRLAPAAGAVPHHQRTIRMTAFDGPGGGLLMVGRLRDERPWAQRPQDLPLVHDLELRLLVTLPDLVVQDAEAVFHTYPHAECPAVAGAFGSLVGLSVGRGWTTALRSRVGGGDGCTHLRELARAMAPAILQAAFSGHTRMGGSRDLSGPDAGAAMAVVAGSCHVWVDGGVGRAKLARGWVPGTTEYPVPPLADLPVPD
jgi:hypothetical protein